MTDDRAEFAANRDAGLVKRHEQRLARLTDERVEAINRIEPPVTDMVIPPEAVEAAAKAIYETPHDGLSRLGYDRAERDIQDLYRAEATAALEAALPHLRPMLELAGNLGRELGRREAAEELAAKCLRRAQLAERVPEGERSGVREGMVTTWLEAERLANEIATKVSTDEPEASQTRCSRCGFYRPSGNGLEHHPKCPHAAKEPR